MILFGIMLPSFTLNIERWRWNEEFQLWVSNQGHFKDKNGNTLRRIEGSMQPQILENYLKELING